jgi:hypothetical protein
MKSSRSQDSNTMTLLKNIGLGARMCSASAGSSVNTNQTNKSDKKPTNSSKTSTPSSKTFTPASNLASSPANNTNTPFRVYYFFYNKNPNRFMSNIYCTT